MNTLWNIGHPMECNAQKRDGTACKAPAMENGRCRIHGGKSLSGVLSPNLRTGRYSKHLPVRLAEKYSEAVNDPELLSVREDIALLDSRLSDVMAAASNQESGELWENLNAARKAYLGASGKDAEEKRQEALSQMLWLINEGYQEWQSWKDIRFMLQERKTLVESERKRLIDMQQMITNEDALLLIGRLGGILKQHITDRDTLRAIAEEMRRITG